MTPTIETIIAEMEVAAGLEHARLRDYVLDWQRRLAAMPVAPQLPEAFAERLADGWTFAYEPETNYVGLNHPHGGKMSVVRVEFGNYDEQIGQAIATLFNSAAPLAAAQGSNRSLATTGDADSNAAQGECK